MVRWMLLSALLALAGCSGGGANPEPQTETPKPVADVPQPTPQPVPPAPTPPDPVPPTPPPPTAQVTVIIVGSSAAATLDESPGACCSDVVTPLREAGFALETLDAPCHGNDRCLVGGLEGYAAEVAAGNREWIDRFCARLREQIADRPVFVAGISRGGYAALSCDLGAPVRGVIGYAPVTDLYQLSEFANVPFVSGFELMPQRVPTLIRIGKDDQRVGTEAAVNYAQQSGAELRLLDTPGHTAPELGDGIEWIRAH